MKRTLFNLFCLAAVLSLVIPSGAIAAPARLTPDPAQTTSDELVTVIVELVDAPLAQYTGGVAGLAPTKPSVKGEAKLDVTSADSRQYVNYLTARQESFKATVRQAVLNAVVVNSYQVVFNGLALRVPESAIPTLQRMKGVRTVTREQIYTINMDASLPLIGAATLWGQVGGQSNAGAGIKVADIDTGIDFPHPFFANTGAITYPVGLGPNGGGWCATNPGYCNGKIILSRYYTPTFPVNVGETLTPQDFANHGSHTAGTMVGNANTVATFAGGLTATISGVAPQAWLMVYKGLFEVPAGSGASGSSGMLLGALEDVVKDGADVVNNSWGGSPINTPENDPLAKASEAAVDAGLVVVFSAGNDGPSANTIGSPGTGDKLITVGASTTDRTYTATLDLSAVGTVYTPTTFTGVSVLTPTVQAPFVDLAGAGYADPIACTGPVTSTLAAGKIVVIQRGVCALVDKVANAAAGGAVGVILRNVAGGATTLPLIVPVLPTIHVDQASGDAIAAWYLTYQSYTPTIKMNGPAVRSLSDVADTVASFSSRGPNVDMNIKPDVSAPGVNILSSVVGGYDLYQGTSMSAPHVTGSAALLKQLHPTWTPAQIKSALMTTAATPTVLGSNPMNRGSGRIDLTVAGNPGLTFDKPSVSFKVLPVNSGLTKVTINAAEVASATAPYTVTVAQTITDTNLAVTTSVSSLVVTPNGAASFDVFLNVGNAAPKDYYGQINLTDGTHMAHIPYWVRVIAPSTKMALLVDWDGSPDFPDYRSYYTSTLDALGVTYDVIDPWNTDPAPSLTTLQKYPLVIIFSGDNYYTWGGPYGPGTTNIRNYLISGGKVLFTGQDYGSDMANYYDAGLDVVAQDVFGSSPTPTDTAEITLTGTLGGPFYGSKIDIGTNYTATSYAAGNQQYVDVAKLIGDPTSSHYDPSDLDALVAAPHARPFLALTNNVYSPTLTGYVGTGMSNDTVLEHRTPTVGNWRAAALTFGLEGIPEIAPAGYLSRTMATAMLLGWFADSLTVSSLNNTEAMGTVTFTATATTTLYSLGVSVVNYRWDFGDGTSYTSTTSNVTQHYYTRGGTYTVAVEVMDSLGHTTVYQKQMAVSNWTFLPLIFKH